MPQAVKVGIFAFIALALLAWFILRIEDIRLFEPPGERLAADFDSVAGLDDKAAVRVAGVRVGRVDGISLVDRKARVGLLLDRPLSLTEGTIGRLATSGLLGERYVELVPGPAGNPPLPEGAVVPGETPVTVDQAIAQLSEVGQSIQRLTGSVEGTLAGGDLDRLLENLAATAEQVRSLVEANRQDVTATAHNLALASESLARELPELSRQMQGLMAQISAVLEENRGELKGSLANVQDLTERMKTSVDHFNDISGKIARGEGTIGKLVNSAEAHDELVSTLETIQEGVEGLSETVGLVRKLHLDLGLEGYYLESSQETHNSFRLDITPEDTNRLYRVALVDDPRGREKTTFESVSVTGPDGNTETTEIETFRRVDDPTFSLLFGFRGARAEVLWLGVIEESAGIQIDYPVLRDKLWVSMEAFDFDRRNDLNPHLRVFTRWRAHRHVYLMGGYDDFLEPGRDSFFLGGGITWSDDNLKALLGTATSAAF
jgi:phospholipid/cholesterol/gamma-HCH transport system substrate-binding protein